MDTFASFDPERVNKLEYITRYINSKFETEALLHIAQVKVIGERDQDCELDLPAGIRDPQRAMYLYYGLRLERLAALTKDAALPVPALIERLVKDFVDVQELFEAETGVSLTAFAKGLVELNASLQARFEQAERLSVDDYGLVQPTSTKTFAVYALSMIFTDAELDNSVNPEFCAYLRSHPFEAAVALDSELRFHYLTRRPFLKGNGFAVVSPDLLYDSVLNNAHYTLLEGIASKHGYKAIGADRFLDKVAQIAADAGYEEIDRDLYLKEGSQNLGDIDLILRHPNTHHILLVEGKDHALPLEVYFRTPQAIEAHVTRNREWETKVRRRIDHLSGPASSYPIKGKWDYLVVSRLPEPLSHVTNLMILCLEEFKLWLAQEKRAGSFEQFYQDVYDIDKPTMSADEMRELQEAGFFLVRSIGQSPEVA
jgi:hypothetical protein